jgi:hypothetical protein
VGQPIISKVQRLFALAIFFSATLLFMVQPLAGKILLPVLGGSPAVWSTCMVFFQAVLLLGYVYAPFFCPITILKGSSTKEIPPVFIFTTVIPGKSLSGPGNALAHSRTWKSDGTFSRPANGEA